MAKAGQKRTYDVSEMETDKNATVHRVVVELSPVKTSNKDAKIKYFSRKVSDGNKAGRVICFEPNLRPYLERFREEKKPIALVNCKVQESKYDQSLEILTSKHTKVECSPNKFDFSEADSYAGLGTSAAEVTVQESSSLAANQRIFITVKVMNIDDKREVQLKR